MKYIKNRNFAFRLLRIDLRKMLHIPAKEKCPIRIIVVEDYEPFRQLICSMLQERAEFQVIGQASDGLEAIEKAEELQPDLILLDIGLPKLDGIAAGRQIRKVVPKSKIVFLSQETDTEIVKAAFSAGANGYVVKSDAGEEMFEALNAVIQDGRFVSRRVEGNFTDIKDTGTPKRPLPSKRNRWLKPSA
jgi:DNA-binding NarL/FixJ family response regulator